MYTGLLENAGCADAIPPGAHIAATAAIRSHLPILALPTLSVSTPTTPRAATGRDTQVRYRRKHVDNPVGRVKFGIQNGSGLVPTARLVA